MLAAAGDFLNQNRPYRRDRKALIERLDAARAASQAKPWRSACGSGIVAAPPVQRRSRVARAG
jgi:hypothetical protein